MSDPIEFLRQSQGQDTTTLLRNLISRVNALENSINRTNTGTNITHPVLPATGVQYTWLGTKPATVYIRGGTVTSIVIGSLAFGIVSGAGLTSGTFRVNPGDYIQVSYSVAPTWEWYGD